MTDLEFCRSTVPRPLLDASVYKIVDAFGLKYGSMTFLEISLFVHRNTILQADVSLNSIFCLKISLSGSLNSAKWG